MSDSPNVMTTGDILGRSFKMYFGRLPLFYAIMLVVELPLLVLQLVLPDIMVSGFGFLLLLPLTMVANTIGTGAMIRVIMQDYLGRPVAFGEALRFAFLRFWSLLGTSLLSGLIIFAGTIACLIPGIYFSIVYSMASQVVIVEDRAGMDALRRSKSLVNSDFGRVFGILILVGLCTGCLSGGVSAACSLGLPYQKTVVSPGDPFGKVLMTSYPNYAINITATTLVTILVQVFMAICVTLLYFDLRNRSEAFDLELESDKISAWTERFRPRPHAESTDIQQPDVAIQPPGTEAQPPSTGIQPPTPQVPPTGIEPPS